MRKTSISLIAMAAALAVAPIALADSITGTLGIGGTDTLNSTSDPTSISFIGTGTVFSGNGTFTGASGPATMTGFTFSDANNVELFDVTSGTGAPITFTIEGPVTATPLGSGSLMLTGSGVLTENGFTATDGTFELTTGTTTVSDGLSTTSFQVTAGAIGSTGPVVPEPSSLVFLGTGLFALALFAFRKARPSGLFLHS
jgi:hypothetical protein